MNKCESGNQYKNTFYDNHPFIIDSSYKLGGTSISSKCSLDNSTPMSLFASPTHIETGTVEHGEHSDQSFVNVNKDFESSVSKSMVFHLKPKSQKLYDVKDVAKRHCPECGTKLKQNWKFCITCGTKQ